MKKLNILVADDDAEQLKHWVQLLIRNGHGVTMAYDGVDAILEYRRSLETFGNDLVLTDFQMPEKGGIDLLKEIRAVNPDARVWIHTKMQSTAFFVAEKIAIKLGAEKFLHKDKTETELRLAGIIS